MRERGKNSPTHLSSENNRSIDGADSNIEIRGKRVLVMKLRYIGDTLSILPVIDNLWKKAPDAAIDVLINKGSEEVLTYHPGIRKVWVYDRQIAKKNIVYAIYYNLSLIKSLRSRHYDIVIDFTHGDRAAFLSFATGASSRITYEKSSSLSHLLMNRLIKCDPFRHHIVDYQLESLRLFGMAHFSREMKVHIPGQIQSKVDGLLAESSIPSTSVKVAIHPGARGRLRQWSPQRFAEIGRRLRHKYASFIILFGGPGEKDLVDSVAQSMGPPEPLKFTELSLLEMGALFGRCHLFLGNDSAPAHIAAAAGCPVLTLFGPTFPHLWRPISALGEVVFKHLPCCGCRQEKCIRPGNSCMDLIGVEEVWEKAERLLSLSRRGASENLS